MTRIVTERHFRDALYARLSDYADVRSVSGPGRSGAIASVYVSHFLGVPWLPVGTHPQQLRLAADLIEIGKVLLAEAIAARVVNELKTLRILGKAI